MHTQSIKTGEDWPKALAGRGKSGENSGLETSTLTSYQRSWKNSRLEKRNIGENSCLRTGTLTDSKRILWEFRAGKGNIQGNSRLHKGNIFEVWSVTSQLGAVKGTRTFLQCNASSFLHAVAWEFYWFCSVLFDLIHPILIFFLPVANCADYYILAGISSSTTGRIRNFEFL